MCPLPLLHTTALCVACSLFTCDVFFLVAASMLCDAISTLRHGIGGEGLAYFLAAALLIGRVWRLHRFIELAEFTRRFNNSGNTGSPLDRRHSVTEIAATETWPAASCAAYSFVTMYLILVAAYDGLLQQLVHEPAHGVLVAAVVLVIISNGVLAGCAGTQTGQRLRNTIVERRRQRHRPPHRLVRRATRIRGPGATRPAAAPRPVADDVVHLHVHDSAGREQYGPTTVSPCCSSPSGSSDEDSSIIIAIVDSPPVKPPRHRFVSGALARPQEAGVGVESANHGDTELACVTIDSCSSEDESVFRGVPTERRQKLERAIKR